MHTAIPRNLLPSAVKWVKTMDEPFSLRFSGSPRPPVGNGGEEVPGPGWEIPGYVEMEPGEDKDHGVHLSKVERLTELGLSNTFSKKFHTVTVSQNGILSQLIDLATVVTWASSFL